jgi:hypothetical protein
VSFEQLNGNAAAIRYWCRCPGRCYTALSFVMISVFKHQRVLLSFGPSFSVMGARVGGRKLEKKKFVDHRFCGVFNAYAFPASV